MGGPQLLSPYIEKISLIIFNKVNDKSPDNLNKIRVSVAELVLQEGERFIRDNLREDTLRARFDKRINQSAEKNDVQLYEETLDTYLQLVPDMMLLLDSRMKGVELVILNKLNS